MSKPPAPNPVPDRHRPDAILARRFKAKISYRRRRDRKIAVDWLGREFIRLYPAPAVRFRLVRYDPATATVKMASLSAPLAPTETWSTDTFWRLLRHGLMENS